MRLVHEITCVKCGVKEYMPSDGKTARSMKGICDACVEKESGVPEKADEPASQPKGVPARRKSA